MDQHQDKSPENTLPEPEDKTPDKLFVPSLIKKPQSQPPKFKYVPPKAGKRHF